MLMFQQQANSERLIGSNFRPVVPVVTKKIGAAHRGWKNFLVFLKQTNSVKQTKGWMI